MDEENRISRRVFIGGAGLLGLATAADAFVLEPRLLEVTRHRVRVPALPTSLEGYTVAQVTDVHLDALGGLHETLLDELRQADCQLAAITGDMIDNPDSLDDVRDLCSQISGTTSRTIAALGNWEHWSKVRLDDIAKLYADCDVELVVDEVVDADVSVAVTDDGATVRADFEKTFAATPRDAPASLLLTHAPGPIPSAPAPPRPFDLVLCGHTHGGQIQFIDTPLMTPPGSGDFVAGWYDTVVGRTYVCRGIGMSILDVRFMCRPELALFELVRA